jgi:hypothetical protein
MAKATFEKMTRSDKALYGPCKLLLCGFPAGAQSKLNTLLDMAGLKALPRAWIVRDQEEMRLSDLFRLPDGQGEGLSSDLPRAIIVAGITEKELIRLMAVCRKTGMKPALWATLTPTSESWTLRALLAELSAERQALQKKKSLP